MYDWFSVEVNFIKDGLKFGLIAVNFYPFFIYVREKQLILLVK